MDKKELVILFGKKEECCGCAVCYAICSQGAISMQPDQEGFLYPVIDKDLCILCKMCVKVCPIICSKQFGKN